MGHEGELKHKPSDQNVTLEHGNWQPVYSGLRYIETISFIFILWRLIFTKWELKCMSTICTVSKIVLITEKVCWPYQIILICVVKCQICKKNVPINILTTSQK